MNNIANVCGLCFKEQPLTPVWLDQVIMQNTMVLSDSTSSSCGSWTLTFFFKPNISELTCFTQVGNTAAKTGTGTLLVKIWDTVNRFTQQNIIVSQALASTGLDCVYSCSPLTDIQLMAYTHTNLKQRSYTKSPSMFVCMFFFFK